MRSRLYLISPKLKMVLSAILLAFSLCFLWSSLCFAMPAQVLAVKKAEAECCLTPRTWELYRPSLDYKSSNAGGWFFSRQGDEFYIAMPFQRDSPLWDILYSPIRTIPLLPYRLNFNPILDASQENFGFIGIDDMILVTTPNPTVARVELVQGSRTADCTESAPGSGFWVGILRTMDTDEDKDFPLLARAYDAAGNLIGSTEP